MVPDSAALSCPMAMDRITVEVRDGIAYATLNRADKMNSLDLPMLEALATVPDRLARDRSVRVVILRGDGRAFCTGLDFAGAKLQGLSAVRNFGKFPGRRPTCSNRPAGLGASCRFR